MHCLEVIYRLEKRVRRVLNEYLTGRKQGKAELHVFFSGIRDREAHGDQVILAFIQFLNTFVNIRVYFDI